MAITSTGLNAATNLDYVAPNKVEDKSILGKDDFLKLLLVQLQYQDPTKPTDSETILTQTSQLASLESTQNTNNALASLSKSLQSSQEFSSIASIGKRADLGSDTISHTEGRSTTFEVFFSEDINNGVVTITDLENNPIATIPIEIPEGQDSLNTGVYQFTWNGLGANGEAVKSGTYHVNSTYTDPNGNNQETRLGAYPIESVRFEDGKTYLKLGSSYVALKDIVEVY